MVKLANAIDEFVAAKTLAGRAEKTLNQYEYVLNSFGEYLGENPELEEITSRNVRGYLNHLFEQDLANTTVAIHFRVMRVFFNWWKAETEITESPMRNVSEPATPDKFPRILKHEQVQQLLETVRKRLNCWPGMRNYALLLTLLDMGLRRQELIDAKLDHLDREGRSLKVNGKGSKDRKVYFGKNTSRFLSKWLKVRDKISAPVNIDNVFIGQNGEELKPRNVNRILNRISKRADMADADVSPHVLRHTSATMAVENGMDAFALKKQFGWEDIETAQRYVHMSGNRLEEAYKKSSPMDHFGKKSGRKKSKDDNDQRGWVNG